MPFVKMTSKATLGQMKSGLAKGTISGTCQTSVVRFKKLVSQGGSEAQEEIVEVNGKTEQDSALFYFNSSYKFEVKDASVVSAETKWKTEQTES